MLEDNAKEGEKPVHDANALPVFDGNGREEYDMTEFPYQVGEYAYALMPTKAQLETKMRSKLKTIKSRMPKTKRTFLKRRDSMSMGQRF